MRARLLAALLLLALVPRAARAQERGAAALGELVAGLDNTMRVLVVGAHPDDEDTRLITWLARGRHVETAYLSLTRGDGGQNLIGNELGEALGAIRTEELLAARRIDGARQYFTRAYDFGFSKNAAETYAHWPKDSVLGDVVRVVRAFRPHVIVTVFSGTRRDGHGHHEVSGLLGREAYDVAADSARYPRAAFGAPWAPLKLYRNRTYWRHEGATFRYDAGEYSPLVGQSYAEIAGRSRSQHKSQGFGSLEPKGAITGSLFREATRVNAATPAEQERSPFDGIDTTWARHAPHVADPARRRVLDSLPAAYAAVRAAFDPFRPEALLAPLARAERLLDQGLCNRDTTRSANPCAGVRGPGDDLAATRDEAVERLHRAVQLAAGVELLATAPREAAAVGDSVPVTVTVYNRGRRPVRVRTMQLEGVAVAPDLLRGSAAVTLAPGDSLARTGAAVLDAPTQPWWLRAPRRGDVFDVGGGAATREEWRYAAAVDVIAYVESDGAVAVAEAPVVRRVADPIRGEITRPLAAAPAVSVTLDRAVEYARAGVPLQRTLRVHLRSASDRARTVTVRLELPRGLAADSAARTATLSGAGAQATVGFTLRGTLPAGRHLVRAVAESDGRRFADGYQLVDYEHVRVQRLYRPAEVALEAVDVALPARATVAYVPGVGDNVAPMLAQLGLPTTVLAPADVAGADLSRYTAVVVGPRAYEAHPALAAANARLLDWARAGGTLVVQYGQYEMTQPGIMPYPITLARPAQRVTLEDAPVTVLDPGAGVLVTPNRIGAADWSGWVQERSIYMPATFDSAYTPVLALGDPGEPPGRGALLVAPLGRGTYVYATLALFRQLPAGNPGAARLFVNLLAARAPAPTAARAARGAPAGGRGTSTRSTGGPRSAP